MRLIFLVASLSAIDRARLRDRLELETEKIHNLGQHNDPISSMNYSQDTSAYLFPHELLSCAHPVPDALITGSWDRTVRFWDPRASTPQVASHEQPERVYFMDLVGNHLVVAMASRLFHIFDIRKMEKPEQTRESSLKFMTRALACMSDGQGKFYVSSFRPFSASVCGRSPCHQC